MLGVSSVVLLTLTVILMIRKRKTVRVVVMNNALRESETESRREAEVVQTDIITVTPDEDYADYTADEEIYNNHEIYETMTRNPKKGESEMTRTLIYENSEISAKRGSKRKTRSNAEVQV